MKLNKILEMTMRVDSYENLSRYISEFEELLKAGIHAGDIEKFKVFKKKRGDFVDYAIFDSGKIAAFFVMYDNTLSTAYVIKNYRKQGIFSAFLLFLKRIEGHSKIVIDDLQSEDTVQALKRIYKRFNIYWVKGAEKHNFNPNVEEPYYSPSHSTGWNVVLENDGDFSDWPKFYDDKLSESTFSLTKYCYFNLLEP